MNNFFKVCVLLLLVGTFVCGVIISFNMVPGYPEQYQQQAEICPKCGELVGIHIDIEPGHIEVRRRCVCEKLQ